jgi:Protein of unknown function (DUF2628)
MRVWTAHEKLFASLVLVPEGFSFGALFFAPIWFAVHRTWLPAVATVLLTLLILLLTTPPASIILILGLALLAGYSGRDLVRWSIRQRGFLETNVITGRNRYDAHARLLEARRDLVERSMAAETAP